MKGTVDGFIFRDLGVVEPGAIDVSKQVVLGSDLFAQGSGVDAWGRFHPFILENPKG